MACDDDLRLKLLYLENRVGLARILFPKEALVAMNIAQVDTTLECPFTANSGNVTPMNLNGAPFIMEEAHLDRMRALSKTVELGRRFFPRCSETLNQIMDADDLLELALLGNDTPEERQIKKKRYIELQNAFVKAFSEDKEDLHKSTPICSSS